MQAVSASTASSSQNSLTGGAAASSSQNYVKGSAAASSSKNSTTSGKSVRQCLDSLVFQNLQ